MPAERGYMIPKARAVMLEPVSNRKGPNTAKKGAIVWISPSFPGADNNFFNIVTDGGEGAATLISDVFRSAFQLCQGERWPVSGGPPVRPLHRVRADMRRTASSY